MTTATTATASPHAAVKPILFQLPNAVKHCVEEFFLIKELKSVFRPQASPTCIKMKMNMEQ
jgi:hypothetical protein